MPVTFLRSCRPLHNLRTKYCHPFELPVLIFQQLGLERLVSRVIGLLSTENNVCLIIYIFLEGFVV